jgi:hypothetical protein
LLVDIHSKNQINKRLTKQPLFAHLFSLVSPSLLCVISIQTPNRDYPFICAEKKEVAKGSAGGACPNKMPPSNSIILVSENICARLFGRAVTAAGCTLRNELPHPHTRDEIDIQSQNQFHIYARWLRYIVKKGMWASK